MSDALSKILREVARRLEWQESYVLPEAWAKSRMMLGRRVCITSEDMGTAVSVMEAAANAIDSAEVALADAQAKLAEMRDAAERVCQDPDDVCDADWRDLRAAIAAAAPQGGDQA